MKNAAQILCESADKFTEKTRFFIKKDSNWESISYKKFFDDVSLVGNYLLDLGLEPGSRTAVFSENSYEWAVVSLAILGSGLTLVPVYQSSKSEFLDFVLEHSDTQVLFLSESLCEVYEKASIRAKTLQILGPSFLKRVQNNNIKNLFLENLHSIDLDQPACQIYTSGTTGNPKGVVLSHRNMASNAEDWLEVFGTVLKEEMKDLLWLPFSHIFGFGELCLGNLLGFKSYLLDPKSVLNQMSDLKPQLFMSVPSHWEKLASKSISHSNCKKEQIKKLKEITGGQLKFCLSGGAGLNKEIKEFFLEAGIWIAEGYGLTECSPTLSLNRPGDFDFNSVGKSLPKVKIKLAEDGEILAKGPNVFKGYYKDPQATKQAFDEEGWFKTGDLGTWTEKGFLKIIGRKKEILITKGGKNISPALIENQFTDESLLDYFVVYGDAKKYLTALIFPNQENLRSKLQDFNTPFEKLLKKSEVRHIFKQIIDQKNKDLASFETIKSFLLSELQLTPENGFLTDSLKLKRKEVYKNFASLMDGLYI